jgi:hypothetical protein
MLLTVKETPSMSSVILQLFTASGVRLELQSAVRFEAENHYQAARQASTAGETWASEDPTNRQFFISDVVEQ